MKSDEKFDYSFVNMFKQRVFWTVHLGCLAVIGTGISWIAALVCVLLYFIRMFTITGVYHRYFSHRSFRTHAWFELILGLAGCLAYQDGPIWWSSKHRLHFYSMLPKRMLVRNLHQG